jgi:hypothetical protein
MSGGVVKAREGYFFGRALAGSECRALSLWQPWASLVIAGVKRIETRCWPTSYRGKLAIQASVNVPKLAREEVMNSPQLRASTRMVARDLYGKELLDIEELMVSLPRGMVLGTVELLDVVRMTEGNMPAEGSVERALGDYQEGRYMWMLGKVERFERPVPAKGGQRLWVWDGVMG